MAALLESESPAPAATQVLAEAAADASTYSSTGEMIKGRMPELVKGAGFAPKDGNTPLTDQTDILRRASQASLDLRLMKGDGGNVPATLMARAADVQHWSIFYNLAGTGTDPDRPRSASLQCTRGQFSDFSTARPAVPDCQSLEDTWVAVTLDSAIAQLNALGYVRGFAGVELKRPDLPGLPADLVYVFDCPWERTYVAISGNTGAEVWYQVY